MTTFSDQLGKGFFPRELPPTFSTVSLATGVQAFRQLPPAFIHPRTARLGSHNIARPGGLRRRLGIPNPVLHIGVCNEISSSWAQIAQFIAQSTLSTSKPTIGSDPVRALAPSESPESLKFIRAQARASARYVLRTDIARFYPSIYTHSIPWALHSKATAKATMGNSALL